MTSGSCSWTHSTGEGCLWIHLTGGVGGVGFGFGGSGGVGGGWLSFWWAAKSRTNIWLSCKATTSKVMFMETLIRQRVLVDTLDWSGTSFGDSFGQVECQPSLYMCVYSFPCIGLTYYLLTYGSEYANNNVWFDSSARQACGVSMGPVQMKGLNLL